MAKILLVAPTCNGDDVGEAWVAYKWALHLAERHQVTLLTYSKRGARPAAQQLHGVEVIEWLEPPLLGKAERLNSIMKPGYIPFYFRARRWIRHALAAGRHFDVAHQPVPVGMRYPSPATGFGIPLVIGPVGGGLPSPEGFVDDSAPWFMSLRGLDDYRRRWDPALRNTYRNADCVLGIAPYVRELLSTVPLRRFEVMCETGLDQLPAPIDRSSRTGAVKLVYVGRLVRTKGARDAIRALSLVPDLDVTLDIIGEGPERAACESLVASLGLAGRVRMHGWLSKPEVAKHYQSADIFVFPSYREPGGNVTLEAMAHSLPSIVVNRGGPGSSTTDLCAVRLPVSTPDALAKDLAAAIRKLVTNPALRLKMGEAAYAHVGNTALWSAKIDRMDALYADLLAPRPLPVETVPVGSHTHLSHKRV